MRPNRRTRRREINLLLQTSIINYWERWCAARDAVSEQRFIELWSRPSKSSSDA